MKAPNQLKCFWTIGLRWSGHSYDHFVSKLQSGMFWRTLNLLFFVWRLLWERGGKEGKGKGKRLEPVTWALCADMQRRWPFSTPGLKISSLALIFFSFSFSQMTLFLFWCRSFFVSLFLSNSDDQLVSVCLKMALLCSPVIAQHTLVCSWERHCIGHG